MAKRSSLFGPDAPAKGAPARPPAADLLSGQASALAPAEVKRYPVAKTREGKRVATVYLDPVALKQLQRLAIDEETSIQNLLVEGINSVFKARGLSRVA